MYAFDVLAIYVKTVVKLKRFFDCVGDVDDGEDDADKCLRAKEME